MFYNKKSVPEVFDTTLFRKAESQYYFNCQLFEIIKQSKNQLEYAITLLFLDINQDQNEVSQLLLNKSF